MINYKYITYLERVGRRKNNSIQRILVLKVPRSKVSKPNHLLCNKRIYTCCTYTPSISSRPLPIPFAPLHLDYDYESTTLGEFFAGLRPFGDLDEHVLHGGVREAPGLDLHPLLEALYGHEHI